MSDFREEEKLGKLYDSQITHRLMQYLRPYRLQVIGALSFTLGITALEIAGPYLFHVGIDDYIVPGVEGQLTRRLALTGLLWVVVAYAGSILASFALQYVQVRIMQWVGQKTMYDLRREIFSQLQRLPMRQLLEANDSSPEFFSLHNDSGSVSLYLQIALPVEGVSAKTLRTIINHINNDMNDDDASWNPTLWK